MDQEMNPEQQAPRDPRETDTAAPQPGNPPEPSPEPRQEAGQEGCHGAPQHSSPYADSPYYQSAQAWQQTQSQPPKPPKKEKKAKKHPGLGKRIAGTTLALAVLAGSCGLTAWSVNSRWEKTTDAMTQSFRKEIDGLKAQIGTGTGLPSAPVSAEGVLTPSQVYAQNVSSVVAISNQSHVQSWNGQAIATSSGTGFIISTDGYIISNAHVVDGAEQLTVTTDAGDEYEAKLIGKDAINDISLLKVEATGLRPVVIGSSDQLIVGDMVVAIGNPLGELTSTQTVGYVSGKNRSVATDGSVINMLQTDAAINPGNSGGPLFNMRGEVVGITTAKYSGTTPSGATIEGIGFAIPIDDVMGMINDFKEFGYLKNQAYLGITVRDLDAQTAQMYSLPSGVFVDSVTEGSCAEKAGIQPKDIITAVGDYAVEGRHQLLSTLRRFSAGDTAVVKVFRAGQELELTVTFDEKPQQEPQIPSPDILPGEMPDSGDYEEWFKYFAPFFGILPNR